MPSTVTIVGTHDRTESEELLLVQLILLLSSIGYSGELHCRCFLVNQSGKARRPDFYLPRYALAIEVDGRTRESWQVRTDDTLERDQFYSTIGTHPPLIIPSNWVVSDYKIERLKNELTNHLYRNQISKKTRTAINKRLHDGRKLFKTKHPELAKDHGTLAPQLGLSFTQLKLSVEWLALYHAA
jgi:hypothetical protein